jgi:bifunctional N-acetylglucosamine-1-phosphate-uridyltransferase/glucosamine-1-phosphate-acetyltransferase GlmU-like protein
MAGEGKRFSDAGYTAHKPVIPTLDYRTGKTAPMVVCATNDLYGSQSELTSLIYVDRSFHKKDGVEDVIRQYYPKAEFITVDALTDGQARTCLLAKEQINNSEPLLIASCDNGMIYSQEKYEERKKNADVLVFTFRNSDAVLKNPDAYGWMRVDENSNVEDVSIKKSISDNPMLDHAVTGAFWFRRGDIFVEAAERMIAVNDRIKGEFYVDQAVKYALDKGYAVKVFEIERYLCWGTPEDYESYQNTYKYWVDFVKGTHYLGM